jgi:hypothetical protein
MGRDRAVFGGWVLLVEAALGLGVVGVVAGEVVIAGRGGGHWLVVVGSGRR